MSKTGKVEESEQGKFAQKKVSLSNVNKNNNKSGQIFFLAAMDRFPAGVEAAIAEVFPSDDPLDAPDFNAIDYINQVIVRSLPYGN